MICDSHKDCLNYNYKGASNMSWKNQRQINVAMVSLSWLSLIFLEKRNIKRFLPASILITLIEGINVQYGKKRKWWVFYNRPNSYISGEFPFNIGPFLIGSIWILKWPYGNFKRFILLNAVFDGAVVLLLSVLSKKMKIFTLVMFNKIKFFLYFFLKSFLLYGFQILFENGRKFTDHKNIDQKSYVGETAISDEQHKV